MLDDELDSKQESLIIWPKAKQLKEVDGGFRIDTNHSTLIYKWVSDESVEKA
jgi:DNA integrity scanning protein DisA with diadenylate cyclase activity